MNKNADPVRLTTGQGFSVRHYFDLHRENSTDDFGYFQIIGPVWTARSVPHSARAGGGEKMTSAPLLLLVSWSLLVAGLDPIGEVTLRVLPIEGVFLTSPFLFVKLLWLICC